MSETIPGGFWSLSAALTREHEEIDGGIESFVASLDDGATTSPDTGALLTAFAALRRHIYLEEEFVFPPLEAAGMWMPIQVMTREHGEIWRAMDGIEAALSALSDGGGVAGAETATADQPGPADRAALLAAARDLLALLDSHNSKEEPVIYPRADVELAADAQERLGEFLREGRTPEGWVCIQAR